MPHIRAWIFDAVGTLIRPEPSAAAVYAAVGRRHGSRLSEDVIARRFRDAFRHEEALDRAANWRTSEEREVARWRQIVAGVLDDLADPETVFRELWDHFARPTAWRCEAGAAEVLAAGERLGLILGVASNFDRRLRSVLAGMPELSGVRHVVVSSEVGWRKPSRAFFDALLGVVGCRPEECLLLGDDVGNDCEGGRAAGLVTVLYDPEGRHRVLTLATIHHLAELLTPLSPRGRGVGGEGGLGLG
jgi:putative hydrolase of the HAD superfamily